MYNNPFYIPGYNQAMIAPNLIRGAATNGLLNGTRGMATNALATGTRSTGLLSKLGTGLSGIKSINWGGLINNTSKTLGIINQTIPLVRQVGPVVNNMRSMIKVASIFKDETDTKPRNINQQSTTNNTNTRNTTSTTTTTLSKTNQRYNTNKQDYNESPTFFIAG